MRLRSLVAIPVLLLLLSAAAGAQSPSRPTVTAAVQVTTNPDPGRAHSSPQIAVNPDNGELVIVESDVRGTGECSIHISADDGRSWFRGGDIMMEPYDDCAFYAEYGAYASMAFGGDGVLHIAFVASEFLGRIRDATPRHVFLARSTDGGRTFSTTMVYEAPDGNPDLGLNKGPMIAVDPNEPSRVYVGWRQGVFRNAEEKLKTNVAASDDGGRTFSEPVDLSDDNGGNYPALGVDSEGTVHAVYHRRVFPPLPFGDPSAPPLTIYHRKSTDHGRTFGDPVELDPGVQGSERPPMVAADPNSDAVYAVWAAQPDPQNLAEGYEKDADVFLVASSDGGRSWSERKVLNDDGESGADQYLPGISIAPNGRVDVAWYDDRLSPGGPDTGFQDVFYTSSSDEARTFAANIRVSDRSIDRNIGVWDNNIGSNHNVGISSTEGAVYFAWQDTRNGDPDLQAEDVYMAKLALGAPTGVAAAGESKVLWSVVGAGIALAVGGLVLLVGTRVSRRTAPERGMERVEAR